MATLRPFIQFIYRSTIHHVILYLYIYVIPIFICLVAGSGSFFGCFSCRVSRFRSCRIFQAFGGKTDFGKRLVFFTVDATRLGRLDRTLDVAVAIVPRRGFCTIFRTDWHCLSGRPSQVCFAEPCDSNAYGWLVLAKICTGVDVYRI